MLNKPRTTRRSIACFVSFFVDEINTNQDQRVNRRNYKCSVSTEIPRLTYIMFSATMFVLRIISNAGAIVPTHFSSQGLRNNAAFNHAGVEKIVRP